MKHAFFVSFLLALSAALPALASSGVLLPGSGTTNPYIAAPSSQTPVPSASMDTAASPSPQSGRTPTQSISTPVIEPIRSVSLPNTPSPAYATTTAPAQAPPVYISAAQQKLLMDSEQEALATSQQAQSQVGQAGAGQTRGEQDQNRQLIGQVSQEAQQSQTRLKVLQGGALTPADLIRLYQP